MRITDLHPKLYVCDLEHPGTLQKTDNLAEADAIMFLCPHCFQKNRGAARTHAVICFKPGKDVSGWTANTARWDISGTNLEDISLSPSIRILAPCKFHGFVRNGAIDFCSDSGL